MNNKTNFVTFFSHRASVARLHKSSSLWQWVNVTLQGSSPPVRDIENAKWAHFTSSQFQFSNFKCIRASSQCSTHIFLCSPMSTFFFVFNLPEVEESHRAQRTLDEASREGKEIRLKWFIDWIPPAHKPQPRNWRTCELFFRFSSVDT